MSDWYDANSVPASGASLSSSVIRGEFTAIQNGLTDKLPALTGAGDEVLKVNAGGTAVETTAQLAVAQGGTGAATLTDGGVLLGSGTGAITAMSVLADGEMIVGDGTTDPVAESGATLRTSIGVGTGDNVEFAQVTVSGSVWSGSGMNLASGDAYSINSTSVLNATTLGSGVTASSLTSVGTLTSLTVGGAVTQQTSGAITHIIGSTDAGGTTLILDGDSNGDGAGGDYAYFSHDTSGDLNISNLKGSIVFKTGSGDTTAITIDDSQRISIGGSTVNYAEIYHGGTFTSGGDSNVAIGAWWSPSITGASGDIAWQSVAAFAGTVTTQAVAEAVTAVSQVRINEPTITLGSGSSVTTSAALYVTGVATEASNNYGIAIDNATTGQALFINQDGNGGALLIDSESTSASVIQVNSPATTTGNGLAVNDCDALTTGYVAYLHSNSSDASSRNLVQIINDNASATGAVCLRLQQDANAEMFATNAPANTTANVVEIFNCNSLTTGSAALFHSNSSDTSTRAIVQMTQDHASATNASVCGMQQDADAPFINFTGSSGASTTVPISTYTTSGATTHHLKFAVAGTDLWVAASTNAPSA